jgi:hypothetical protein
VFAHSFSWLTILTTQFARATTVWRKSMRAASPMNFGTSRWIGNCSIASPLRSVLMDRSVTWVVGRDTLPVIFAIGECQCGGWTSPPAW